VTPTAIGHGEAGRGAGGIDFLRQTGSIAGTHRGKKAARASPDPAHHAIGTNRTEDAMRIWLLAGSLLLVAGCADYRTGRTDPYPRTERADRRPDDRAETPVDRWTRRQRACETADRDKQRRCPSNFPGS
jgi:hypothetical protein